jgi:hypothetical protein
MKTAVVLQINIRKK